MMRMKFFFSSEETFHNQRISRKKYQSSKKKFRKPSFD